MKSKNEIIDFIKYVENFSRVCIKSADFNLQNWINDVLQNNIGYEDYFIIIYPNRPKDSNVGLFRYSDTHESIL